jgi:hypothetical protein
MKLYIIALSAIALFGISLISPITSLADEAGGSLHQEVGEFAIDVRYPSPPEAKKPIFLNFFLVTAKDQKDVPFTDLDVEVINADNQPILKFNVNRKQGIATGATVTFPEKGTYKINLAFNNEDQTITRASFDLPIPKSSADKTFLGIHGNKELIIGVVFGFALLFILLKYIKVMHTFEGDENDN